MFTSIRASVGNNRKMMVAHCIKAQMIWCLICSVCSAFEPEVTVKINFHSCSNLTRQQPNHSSAASNRYLHNQLFQQLCFAESDLTDYSAKQLAQYFAQQRYSEEQILQHHTLYLSPEFIKLIKSCAGYQQYITLLNKKLKQKNGFMKWIGTFTDNHAKGFTKRVAELYAELEQEKVEKERLQQVQLNQSKQAYENNIQQMWHQQQQLLQDGAVLDWHELSALSQEYESGDSAHLQRRYDALEEIQNYGAVYSNCIYTLPGDVARMLRSSGYDPTHYATVYGNQSQQALHRECIQLLERTAILSPASAVYVHKETLVDCIDAARAFNQAGLKHEISVLRNTFDCTRKVFAEFANKYIKITYEHILGMELNFGCEGFAKISGFHHDLTHMVEKSGAIEFANKIMHEVGFYSADLTIDGFKFHKTFFPAEWPREKVISKICEAYDDFIKSGVIPKPRPNGKYLISGSVAEGVQIEMWITQKGKIVTAYPILK